ncbi:hypothetical protein D3C78_1893400 [compost metagenome]
MLLFIVVITEAVLVDAFDGDAHHLLAVRHDDAFVCHHIGKILFDCLAHLLLMACLVLIALAVQGPIFTGDDK